MPTTFHGWLVALTASFIGFLAGFYSLSVMGRWFGQ